MMSKTDSTTDDDCRFESPWFATALTRSLESATASRNGKLGLTTTPFPDGSELSPFAASFALMSPSAPPVTYTSYLSPPTGASLALEDAAPPRPDPAALVGDS